MWLTGAELHLEVFWPGRTTSRHLRIVKLYRFFVFFSPPPTPPTTTQHNSRDIETCCYVTGHLMSLSAGKSRAAVWQAIHHHGGGGGRCNRRKKDTLKFAPPPSPLLPARGDRHMATQPVNKLPVKRNDGAETNFTINTDMGSSAPSLPSSLFPAHLSHLPALRGEGGGANINKWAGWQK